MTQRTALITGGMGGLGETISMKMHDAGYRVVVTRSPGNKNAENWLADMKARGYQFAAFPIDVADYDSCELGVSHIHREIGPIDILINNAGITKEHTFKKMTKADWDAVIHTNLDSVFNMTGMVTRGWGRIINVSSVNGQKGAFGQTNYSAAKAGMHGFTKALAIEVAKGRDRQHHLSRLHWNKDGDGHSKRHPRRQNPSADPTQPTRQAGRGRRLDRLSVLGRGGIHHRRQRLHKRWSAHAMSEWVRAEANKC
jgi:acetoacetyl-CoA reductase